MRPEEIERESFAVIAAGLDEMGLGFPPDIDPVVRRVIHATADFDFASNLVFSGDAVSAARSALRAGAPFVTDTRMAQAGMNAPKLRALGCEVRCHIADEDVAEAARLAACTRSRAAVDKAARLSPSAVFVVGNAPTALIRICELVDEGLLSPRLVVGVPVGFVKVVESKELLLASKVPLIVARGRKGGSSVAAAICNALLYDMS